MTGHDKIRSILEKKGWRVMEVSHEPVTYLGRDGREGGWFITFDIEDCDDELYDELNSCMIVPNGAMLCAGLINAFNLKAVFELLKKVPCYREPIETNEPTT